MARQGRLSGENTMNEPRSVDGVVFHRDPPIYQDGDEVEWDAMPGFYEAGSGTVRYAYWRSDFSSRPMYKIQSHPDDDFVSRSEMVLRRVSPEASAA